MATLFYLCYQEHEVNDELHLKRERETDGRWLMGMPSHLHCIIARTGFVRMAQTLGRNTAQSIDNGGSRQRQRRFGEAQETVETRE